MSPKSAADLLADISFRDHIEQGGKFALEQDEPIEH